MGDTIWQALLGIITLSIRLLFWPLGFIIKHREFFALVLPYLFLGVTALVLGLLALGLLGNVLRALFLIVRGVFRFFGAIVGVFRSSHRDKPQDGKEGNPRPQDEPNDPYQILGVAPGVSTPELNAKYKQLMSANHPDKVAQLDPEIQAFAHERARRIIQAYEAVSGEV